MPAMRVGGHAASGATEQAKDWRLGIGPRRPRQQVEVPLDEPGDRGAAGRGVALGAPHDSFVHAECQLRHIRMISHRSYVSRQQALGGLWCPLREPEKPLSRIAHVRCCPSREREPGVQTGPLIRPLLLPSHVPAAARVEVAVLPEQDVADPSRQRSRETRRQGASTSAHTPFRAVGC
jgi:hypothetical protein